MAIQSSQVENNDNEDGVLFFKPGLRQTGFFGCGEEWYHYQ